LIVNAKLEGKLTNAEITSMKGVSTRRVQQLYSEYKSTGILHVQKKARRHKQPLPEQVKYEIIKL
jgi:transposase